MKLVILCYHYIRKRAPKSGIYPVTPKFFAGQLDRVHRAGYRFIELSALCDAIRARDLSRLPEKACLITFDDGLRESFELGYSVMAKKGIPGGFFVVSSALDRERVLEVHKIHYVRSRMSDKRLLALCTAKWKAQLSRTPSSVIREQYPWDGPQSGELKYLLNFLMRGSDRKRFLASILQDELGVDEAALASRLYMTARQIQDLGGQHFLGSHSDTHRPLAQLSEDQIDRDIRRSMSKIKKASGQEVRAISYPYGGRTAFDRRVLRASRMAGLDCGMTVLKGVNHGPDILKNAFALKRFDTNDVFGGRDSALHREGI